MLAINMSGEENSKVTFNELAHHKYLYTLRCSRYSLSAFNSLIKLEKYLSKNENKAK